MNAVARPFCSRLTKQSVRSFATKAAKQTKETAGKKGGRAHTGNGIYTAHKEKLFKLKNGFFILYLHRQAWYTVPLLFMRFIVPLAVLTVLIKKNPFYRTYPIMLPIMVTLWFFTLYRAIVYSRRTNRMVHQILLDQTGSELTFVYKN